MSAPVFVSYSQPDRECAFELVARLEARELSCWIAPRDISPAADWAAEIIEAISAARVMVLVFSAHSNDSPQVRREVERAVYNRLHILPFRIADVRPSKSLEYFLSTQHWLDAFPTPADGHYRRLCEVVGSTLRASCGPSVDGAQGPQRRATDDLTGAGHLARAGDLMGAQDLERLQAQLASYIGPMARLLVRRALSRAGSRQELLELLAAELTSEDDRRQFVHSGRALGQHRD
jgi:hypothetical protein